MNSMKLRNALSLSIAAGILASLSLVPASAATTFASFLFDTGGANVVGNGAGMITGTGINVVFSYVPGGVAGSPSVGFGNIAARLNFSAVAVSNATGGTRIDQDYNVTSFSINSVVAMNDGNGNFVTNLLSGSAIPVTFDARNSVGSLTASSPSVPPSTILFNSAFVTFGLPQTGADLGWTLTNITPNAALSGNNIAAFTSSIAGTFGYDPKPVSNVPEPGAVAMFAGMGLSASLFALRLRRRRK